ncbi:hypothetical protein ACEE21_15520, partial [Clostridium baratii]
MNIKDVKKVLGYYYDPYCGRFGIPMKDVNSEKTEAILTLLRNGYAMTAYEDEDRNFFYTIFNLKDDSQGFGKIDKCKDVLFKLESGFNCKYFTKVSFDNYNGSVQSLIDTVLWKGALFENQVDGY